MHRFYFLSLSWNFINGFWGKLYKFWKFLNRGCNYFWILSSLKILQGVPYHLKKTQDRLCKKICCKHTRSAWLHFSSLKAPFRQSPAFRQLYLPASFYPRCSIWWKDFKVVYRSKSLHSRCCENSDWKSDNICIPHVPCLLCGGYLHSIEAIKSLSHPEAVLSQPEKKLMWIRQYNCRWHGLIWPTDVLVRQYAGKNQ